MTPQSPLCPKLAWLVASRWVVLVTKLALLVAAVGLAKIALPLGPLLGAAAVLALTNAALLVWLRGGWQVRPSLLAAVIALDTCATTVELWCSGGAANPLTSMYLVLISFAAVVLESRWTWGLVAVAATGYGLLYLGAVALPIEPADHMTQMRIHLQGMWIAFLVAAALIGYSVTHVQRLLAAQNTALCRASIERERSQRFASVATLAAGAAHELATPLSTIAIIAKELERRVHGSQSDLELVEDAKTLREEVRRCRGILDRLSRQVSVENSEQQTAIGQIVAMALADLPRGAEVSLSIPSGIGARRVLWPPQALAVSIRNVVQNALDATGQGGKVELSARETDAGIVMEVCDSGAGMTAADLRRATEPFFTRKQNGGGMGLGLFLTQGLMDQIGANLELRSEPGIGTTVTFTFPIAMART